MLSKRRILANPEPPEARGRSLGKGHDEGGAPSPSSLSGPTPDRAEPQRWGVFTPIPSRRRRARVVLGDQCDEGGVPSSSSLCCQPPCQIIGSVPTPRHVRRSPRRQGGSIRHITAIRMSSKTCRPLSALYFLFSRLLNDGITLVRTPFAQNLLENMLNYFQANFC